MRLCRVLAVHEPPFRPAVLEAPGRAAGRLQPADRLVRVGAERAAAVGDDLAVGGQLGEPLLELVERDRARALDVAGRELLRRAHVDEHDRRRAEPRDQLVAADRLDVLAEVLARGSLDFGQAARPTRRAAPATATAPRRRPASSARWCPRARA